MIVVVQEILRAVMFVSFKQARCLKEDKFAVVGEIPRRMPMV